MQSGITLPCDRRDTEVLAQARFDFRHSLKSVNQEI